LEVTRKKIFYINVEANFGSTGKIVESLGQLAQRKGSTTYLAHGRKYRASKLITYKIGNLFTYGFHFLLSILFDGQGRGSYLATKHLVRRINKIKPDVIHLHNIHGYYINYKVLFRYLEHYNGILIWTLHDCWALTGHCTHYDHVGCEKWKVECHSCPQQNKYPTSLLLDRSRKNHQKKKQYFSLPTNLKIITVSNWLNRQVKQSFLSNINTQTIYNGIDTSIFKKKYNSTLREQFHIDNKFIILGVASVWSETKGLSDFIKLSKTLKENEKIVLIGLSKNQISKLPISIIGLERTDTLEILVEWYSTANVYVNTSYEETFGMTTVEAMACGTPAVVYNSTACDECITNEVGFSVEKSNITQLKNALEIIKTKGNGFYDEPCRRHVEENFEKNNRYKEYLKLYEIDV